MERRDAGRYSKEGWRSVLLAVVFFTVGGCKCAEAQRKEDLERLPQGAGSLQDQLAAEAAGRPGQTPTLEALMAPLTKDGVAFGAPRQLYGKKLLATYCAAVDSLDGMIITLCEYPTADQATRGEAEAKLTGSLTAGFQSRVKRKSVLQLVSRSTTPPENVAKVLTTFDGL